MTRTLSEMIEARPETFSTEELVREAEALLRDRDGVPLYDALSAELVDFYVDRELLDRRAGEDTWNRRHLLQLMAVQVLRGLDMRLTDIGELVRGMEDGHLKMLCDDPAEAGKKALVMKAWLGTIARGRFKTEAHRPPVMRDTPNLSPQRMPPPRAPGRVPKQTLYGGVPIPSGAMLDEVEPPPDDLPSGRIPAVRFGDAARHGPTTGYVPDDVGARVAGEVAPLDSLPAPPEPRGTSYSIALAEGLWRRVEVAAGVELHIATFVDVRPETLADALRELLAAKG